MVKCCRGWKLCWECYSGLSVSGKDAHRARCMLYRIFGEEVANKKIKFLERRKKEQRAGKIIWM